MRALLRSKIESITIQRLHSVTVSSAKAYDPATGLDSGITLSVTDGAVNASLLAAVARNDQVISATGLVAGTRYQLVSSDGRELTIISEAVTGTTVTLASKVPFAIAAGTVKSVNSTVTLTVPATFTGRLLEVEYTLSDATVEQESFLVASRRLVTPITTEDILTRYPRMRNRTQGELGFDRLIADAVLKARAMFWGAGALVLDDIRSPAMLRDYLIADVSLQLIAAGYDLSAGGDAYENKREFMALRDREQSLLLSSPNLWIDSDEDRIQTDGELRVLNAVQANWRNRE